MHLLSELFFYAYLWASFTLLLYGLNHYVVLFLFRREYQNGHRRNSNAVENFCEANQDNPEAWPLVTTQIPLYNEFNVAERIIRAVAAIDYPQEKHEIQILDDSNDETCAIVDQLVAELTEQGYRITAFRRTDRVGFKAGALNAGMAESDGEFIAIFDSDFVPPKDFLKQSLPLMLEQSDVGLVQTRWGHLNATESLLTRAQSLGIDGHFVVEQSARCFNRLFMNFNGTAGLWRRKAIDTAGGWESDTLTEDMDLSYRAQLAGWRIEYRPDIVVPAELPNTYTAFKSQQFRWAKGSLQTAIKLLPRVFRSKTSFLAKMEAFFHLTHYCIHPLMLTLAICALPALLFNEIKLTSLFTTTVAIPLAISCFGPSLIYIISQIAAYRNDWPKRIAILPALMVVGFGICLSNSRAVFEALFGIKSAFIRTPKKGSKTLKSYASSRSLIPLLEIGLGLYCIFTMIQYVRLGQPWIGPFLALYAFGFLTVGLNSLRDATAT